MRIGINKAHYPVTALGYGRRIGIWTQGCTLHCKGCISQDTWTWDPSREMEIDDLIEWSKKVGTGDFNGITISGGEPLEQPGALRELLTRLRSWTDALDRQVDYLCYTGFKSNVARKQYPEILELLDVLIPEPYQERLPVARLRGSSNQPVLILTPLGAERYAGLQGAASPGKNQIQIAVDGDSVWFVGIPSRGDMDKLKSECAARGLQLNAVSWRP